MSAVEFVPAAEPRLQLAYRRYSLHIGEQASETRALLPSCTLLMTHATGLCKEVYEPLLRQINAVRGEAIVMELRSHGDSCVANLPLFDSGAETTNMFRDYQRDILALVDGLKLNDKRRPLIGIGHSVGGAAMLLAASMRPGTFDAIVAIEPMLSTVDFSKAQSTTGNNEDALTKTKAIVSAIKNRRISWPNRIMARQNLLGRGMFKNWDNEVFDTYIKYGLRDIGYGKEVTLKCPPRIEVDGAADAATSLYRAFECIPEIQVPILLIGGAISDTISPKTMAAIGKQCTQGKVVILEGMGHMLPLQDPKAVANTINQFLTTVAPANQSSTMVQAHL